MLLVDRLSEAALPELIRTIRDLEDYYSRPVTVTPASRTVQVTSKQGKRVAAPVLSLSEG